MKLLSIVLLFFISCKDKGYRFKKYHDVLYEGQCIPIPEYYRHLIGYDSVQFIDFMDKPEANFCYPNKWVKYKRDTVFIHDTVVVYDIPKTKTKLTHKGWICKNCDTLFVDNPLYIDSTTVKGKRIIKIKK